MQYKPFCRACSTPQEALMQKDGIMWLAQPGTELQNLFHQDGTLLVLRSPSAVPKPAPRQPGVPSSYTQPYDDIFVAMLASGRVLAFNGHVDLGTGVRTALAQIVAEELYLPVDRVSAVLGHTSATPNQGPTVASATLQITAVPLRQAAAQAREFLLDQAAQLWGVEPAALALSDGVISAPDGRRTDYWTLLQ